MSTFEALLIAYMFLGCAYWLYMAVGAVRVLRSLPRLAREEPPQPDDWPRLSIIVPAANEADSIESAVRSILADDYPDLELVLIDDMGLALMLKRHGARACLADGREMLGLYWYRSVREMARGTEKAFASVADARPERIAALATVIVLLEIAPLVAFLPLGVPALWPAGVAMLSALLFMVTLGWCRAGRRPLPGLLWPVGLGVSIGLLLRSAWIGWRRGGIDWRGTFYPTPLLREGKRVRLL